jgi:fumarate reductase flavoprotein subunit
MGNIIPRYRSPEWIPYLQHQKETKEYMQLSTKLFSKGVFLFVLLLIIGGCNTATEPEPYVLHFTPGTYQASATGYNQKVPIVVSVTFTKSAIESITVVSHGETEGVSDVTIERIPPAIVEQQTLAIDAVSGATALYSKKAILAAVEGCVRQAGGDAAVAALKKQRG